MSIGEGAAGGADAGKFIGAARYTLHNVAPRAGGVDIWINIEWSCRLLSTSITWWSTRRAGPRPDEFVKSYTSMIPADT